MGLSARSSKYSCVWCTCSSHDRADTKRAWSMTDTEKGARSIESMQKMCKQKNYFSCVASCIFCSIPVHNVVPDILH